MSNPITLTIMCSSGFAEAYNSDSASGIYIENELFEKLGVKDSVQPKAKMIEKTPVSKWLSREWM